MNSEDGQVDSVCKLLFSCFTKYNRMQLKHTNKMYTQQTKLLQITAFSVGITLLTQRIIWLSPGGVQSTNTHLGDYKMKSFLSKLIEKKIKF